jgi:hypothetical protein
VSFGFTATVRPATIGSSATAASASSIAAHCV